MSAFVSMNEAYDQAIFHILNHPDRVGVNRKGEKLYERFNYEFTLENPLESFATIRDASLEYLEREFEFYCSGSNLLTDALKLSKFWSKCSDDGITINSNYGRLLLHNRNAHGKTQFEHAIDCLINNPESKKAVMAIYSPENAYISNDNPCTMFLSLRIENQALHMDAVMRSSDLWFGVPYDVPFFCAVLCAAHIRLQNALLHNHGIRLLLGTYTHRASNLHIYERNKEALEKAYTRVTYPPHPNLLPLYNKVLNVVSTPDTKDPVELYEPRDYISLAWVASERSNCLKKECGAVLVDAYGKILSSGFSGKEFEPCTVCARGEGEKYYGDSCPSVHAEMRAIINALKTYPALDLSRATMYTTHGPCDACMKLMDFVGIRNCVYDVPYKTNYGHFPRVRVSECRVRADVEGKSADRSA